MKSYIDEIKEKAVPILKRAGVTRSSVFGSVARGEQSEKSDIDVLVSFSDVLSLFEVAELKYRLEDALGKKVDLVQYSKIKPDLKETILSDQIRIL